jgi:transcriptional regulator with XRE-family HTH domain
MGKVIRPDHWAASADLKKASIGTSPADISLKRLARPRDASFRRAKMLRRCATEIPADSASCRTVIPFDSAQRSMGCCSDMATDISPRNERSQGKIFLTEITLPVNGLVKCGMGKPKKTKPRKLAEAKPKEHELFLAEWMKHKGIGPGKLGKIVGKTQGYMSNLKRGFQDNPSIYILLAISEYWGISVNELFKPPPSPAEAAARQAANNAIAAIRDSLLETLLADIQKKA